MLTALGILSSSCSMPRDSCGHVAFPNFGVCVSRHCPPITGRTNGSYIRLTDREQRDIFLRFCRDIVDSTVLANDRGAGSGAVSRPDLAVAPASSGWARQPPERPGAEGAHRRAARSGAAPPSGSGCDGRRKVLDGASRIAPRFRDIAHSCRGKGTWSLPCPS